VTGPVAVASRVNFRDPAVICSLLIPGLVGTYLLLTSTTTLIQGIWPYDTKRILQLGLLLVLFLITSFNGKIREQFGLVLSAVPGWLRLSLAGLFAWGTLSAFSNAESVGHALNSLSEVVLLATLSLGVFAVAACRRVGGPWFDRIAVGLIALTGLAVGLQELFGALAAHASGLDFSYRVSLLHFSWPRFYNQVQSWTVPLLVAIPTLFYRRPLAIGLCLIALGLQWYILLMTGARGSVLAISAAVIWALLFFPFLRRKLLRWQLAGLFIGLLIYSLLVFSFENNAPENGAAVTSTKVQELSAEQAPPSDYAQDNPPSDNKFFAQSLGRPMTSTFGRSWMWQTAWQEARTHPWFGIGPMNFVCTRPPWFGHPHNFPLQIAAEWGLPAALALCLITAYILLIACWQFRARQGIAPANRVLAGLLLTSVIAAAIHACLSGVLVMPASQTTGLLIGGTLLGLIESGKKPTGAGKASYMVIPGLIFSVALLGFGLQEMKTMNARAENIPAVESLTPRIWQNSRVCTLTTNRFPVTE